MDPKATLPDPPKYRPLVPLGADREEIFEAVVQGWLTPVGENLTDDALVEVPGTLVGVHLYDANSEQPIDLGELVRRMEERLGPASKGGPNARPNLAIRLSECLVDRCGCSHLVIQPRFMAVHTCFGEKASFTGATFGDRASFSDASFGDEASFDKATFGDEASFDKARFGKGANFYQATFGDGASFYAARFRDRARFGLATFGDGASFFWATFGSGAHFYGAAFGNRAGFDLATFGDGASFDQAKFGNRASFDQAKFGNRAGFKGATLGDASFLYVDGRSIAFDNLHFGRRETNEPAWSRWLERRVDWGLVRALGNLQVLTRVSYLSLVLVPVLAGMWPAVWGAVNGLNSSVRQTGGELHQAAEQLNQLTQGVKKSVDELRHDLEGLRHAAKEGVPPTRNETTTTGRVDGANDAVRGLENKAEQPGRVAITDHSLPISLALGFFAALAVAAGHLVYQLAAPQLIREKSRADLVSELCAAFGDDRLDRDDRLYRAFDALREIALRLPHERHRNFVRRHGRVVWLPSELKRLTEPPISKKTEETAPESSGEPATKTRPDSERMRIVIDEGARAEYDLAAHDQLNWARVAGGLYAVGSVLIVVILSQQAYAVAKAARWGTLLIVIAIGIPVVSLGIWQFVRFRSRHQAQRETRP